MTTKKQQLEQNYEIQRRFVQNSYNIFIFINLGIASIYLYI